MQAVNIVWNVYPPSSVCTLGDGLFRVLPSSAATLRPKMQISLCSRMFKAYRGIPKAIYPYHLFTYLSLESNMFPTLDCNVLCSQISLPNPPFSPTFKFLVHSFEPITHLAHSWLKQSHWVHAFLCARHIIIWDQRPIIIEKRRGTGHTNQLHTK